MFKKPLSVNQLSITKLPPVIQINHVYGNQ